MQFDEYRDLGADDFGDDRNCDVIDGPDFVAPHAVQVGGIYCRHEDDWRLGEAWVFADKRLGLKTIHSRRIDVEQNDGNFFVEKDLESLIAVLRAQQSLP